jgi:hypothetical protein
MRSPSRYLLLFTLFLTLFGVESRLAYSKTFETEVPAITTDIQISQDPDDVVSLRVLFIPVKQLPDIHSKSGKKLQKILSDSGHPLQILELTDSEADSSLEILNDRYHREPQSIFDGYNFEKYKINPQSLRSWVADTFEPLRHLKQAYQKPTSKEKYIGITTGIYRGVTTTIVSYIQSGINPLQAAGIGIIQTLYYTLTTTYGATIGRALSLNFPDPINTERTSIAAETTRRFLFAATVNGFTRTITDLIKGGLNFHTFHDSLLYTLTYFPIDQFSNNKLIETYGVGSPELTRINFATGLILFPIKVFDLLAGSHFVLIDLNIITLSVPRVTSIATSLVLNYAISKNPEKTVQLLDQAEHRWKRLGQTVKSVFKKKKPGQITCKDFTQE